MSSEAETEPVAQETPAPSEWFLLRVWFLLGMQSFGGGVATLALIRQAVVERHRWVSEEEFVRCLAISNLAPGINLFALAIMLGKRIAGWRGIFACLFGLIFPSATIAILMTAGYAYLREMDIIQAAMRGVLPATLGLGLLVSIQIARPQLVAARRDGRGSLEVCLGLLLLSAFLAATARLPVLLILFLAGGINAVSIVVHGKRPPIETESEL